MINFDQIVLPDHSRIWIYQADAHLSPKEESHIIENGKAFTEHWAAHGNELMADIHVLLGHFIVIVLDEQVEAASGCSIDKSMRFILELQREMDVSFTNRLISAFYIDNHVRLYPYAAVKNALESGEIKPDSLVFDNTIQTVKDLKNNWLKPLKDTWLRKLLEPQNMG